MSKCALSTGFACIAPPQPFSNSLRTPDVALLKFQRFLLALKVCVSSAHALGLVSSSDQGTQRGDEPRGTTGLSHAAHSSSSMSMPCAVSGATAADVTRWAAKLLCSAAATLASTCKLQLTDLISAASSPVELDTLRQTLAKPDIHHLLMHPWHSSGGPGGGIPIDARMVCLVAYSAIDGCLGDIAAGITNACGRHDATRSSWIRKSGSPGEELVLMAGAADQLACGVLTSVDTWRLTLVRRLWAAMLPEKCDERHSAVELYMDAKDAENMAAEKSGELGDSAASEEAIECLASGGEFVSDHVARLTGLHDARESVSPGDESNVHKRGSSLSVKALEAMNISADNLTAEDDELVSGSTSNGGSNGGSSHGQRVWTHSQHVEHTQGHPLPSVLEQRGQQRQQELQGGCEAVAQLALQSLDRLLSNSSISQLLVSCCGTAYTWESKGADSANR
jgi:hypothetical protein